MKRFNLIAIAALAMIPAGALADNVTFDGLAGNNGDAFTTYNEGSFQVTPTGGAWQQGQVFGNPVPDIFSASLNASVDVFNTSTGSFTFQGVDLANAGFGDPTYTITGLLGGNTVFSTNGSLPNFGFTTVNSPSGQTIDDLRIAMSAGNTSDYNIDNIQVTPSALAPAATPEFGSVFSLGGLLAGAGAGLWARRRRRAVAKP